MYYVYILRCIDYSLYTGITTDYKRRYHEHITGVGAKYTKSHKPISIEALFTCKSRKEASILEYAIKQLSKEMKEKLIQDKDLSILNSIDISLYKSVDLIIL